MKFMKITEEAWEKLMNLKIKWRKKNVSEVIIKLCKNAGE